MVNLAEELHRERRRREHAIAGEAPLRGSLETLGPAAAALHRPARDPAGVHRASDRGAAPHDERETRSDRRRCLRESDERVLTAEEDGRASMRELRAQIVLLWQSNELYATRADGGRRSAQPAGALSRGDLR